MNSLSLPILIMTRNDAQYLDRCVSSIFNSVSIDVVVHIIDNHSDDEEHIAVLMDIERRYPDKVYVTRNKNNRWVLGINNTLKKIKERTQSPFFFLTDGDIDFSNCTAKPCWLSYLIDQMNRYSCVGKVGLSLSWSYLKSEPALFNVLKQEESLYTSRKIGDLFVSPVDTTAALYRWGWSIEKSDAFYPDHMRYLRPELYSCRTDRQYVVEHLGWYNYLRQDLNKSHVDSKVLCFTLVGGDVKEQILNLANLKIRLLYRFLHLPIRKLWIMRRVFVLFKYLFAKRFGRFDGYGFNSDI
jgi:glycosyltransferase involved in cell wall biosynthesis